MFFPTSISAELGEKAPQRGPLAEVRTIAVAIPSTLESVLGVADPGRGRFDPVAWDLIDRLRESERVSVVSPEVYHAALLHVRRTPDSLVYVSLAPDPDRNALILEAARMVKADAVLLLRGNWDTPISRGDVTFGRPEYKRRLVMTLLAAKTGEPIWYQEATAAVSQGIAVAQDADVRDTVASKLVNNLLRSLK